MGQLRTYICNSCSYSAEASAKEEWTFVAVLHPFICTYCRELVMVPVGEYGVVQPEIAAGDYTHLSCPNCHSIGHLVKWQPRRRPCPKCTTGKMEEDPNGVHMLID